MKWFSLLLILLTPLAYSRQSTEFELTSGDTISADVYSADTQVLFLYLLSERGFGKGYAACLQRNNWHLKLYIGGN